ncbi:MAG: GIY-YIG nuclease family protein [Gammaproteobacteria bacterium]
MTHDSAWHVYMLRCADQTLYTGVTKDLQARLSQHNRGKASRYTRARLPVEIVYTEPAADHGSALRREMQIKKLARSDKEQLINTGDS